MGKGRPRKQGRRDKSGKLRPIALRDPGNDKTAQKVALFGSDGSDAIGRAYRFNLLGEDGKALMDKARTIKKTRRYTTEAATKANPTCALNQDRGVGLWIDLDPDGQRRREQRMFDALSCGGMTKMESAAFYGLVIHDHSDSGPEWLDRLLLWEMEKRTAAEQKREPRKSLRPKRADDEFLSAAISALKAA